MQVVNNVLKLIGQTPIIKMERFVNNSLGAELYVKLECFNPGGSIKDRPGLFVIEKAEAEGKLHKNSKLIEATSGNMGIGLAMAATIKGYPLYIVMPENMSEERKKILRMYGAHLVLTPAEQGMAGAVEKAEAMTFENPDFFMVRQFENPANSESHTQSTAQEILEQMDKDIDVLVCGIGTGGTISGLGQVLKAEIPGIKIVGVEPQGSAVLSGFPPGSHKIQGIGAGFIPAVLNKNVIDEIITVQDEAAITTCQKIAASEALLLGISSGAAIYAASKIAQGLEAGKKVLAIAPDGAEKYLSTELFTFKEA
jgi:cysteine synthase A